MSSLVYETTCRCPRFDPAGPSLIDQIHLAAAAGFTAVTLDEWTLAAWEAGGGLLTDLRAAFTDAGVRCAGIVALRSNASITPTESARRLQPLVEALHPTVLLTSIEGTPSADVMTGLRIAAAMLRDSGARLAVEFMPFRPVATLADGRAIAAEIGNGAGICLDVWHLSHGPSSQWEALADVAAEEIVYVQFADAPPLASEDLEAETSSRRTMPGHGSLDLDRFVSLVRATGWDGDVGVEVLSSANGQVDPAVFAHQLWDTASKYWREDG